MIRTVQGATHRVLRVPIRDGNGDLLDIANATITGSIKNSAGLVWAIAGDTVSSVAGYVDWTPDETDIANYGEFWAQFQFAFDDGRPDKSFAIKLVVDRDQAVAGLSDPEALADAQALVDAHAAAIAQECCAGHIKVSAPFTVVDDYLQFAPHSITAEEVADDIALSDDLELLTTRYDAHEETAASFFALGHVKMATLDVALPIVGAGVVGTVLVEDEHILATSDLWVQLINVADNTASRRLVLAIRDQVDGAVTIEYTPTLLMAAPWSAKVFLVNRA